MSKRLSDDEKRYFTDQISMLKGENERLTKCVEDLQTELEVLKEYVTHKPGCNVYYAVYERDAKPICNCGFDALPTPEGK